MGLTRSVAKPGSLQWYTAVSNKMLFGSRERVIYREKALPCSWPCTTVRCIFRCSQYEQLTVSSLSSPTCFWSLEHFMMDVIPGRKCQRWCQRQKGGSKIQQHMYVFKTTANPSLPTSTFIEIVMTWNDFVLYFVFCGFCLLLLLYRDHNG